MYDLWGDKCLNIITDVRNFFDLQECGPLEEKGMIMGVLTKAVDVLVLSLGVVKRVYCEVRGKFEEKQHWNQFKENKLIRSLSFYHYMIFVTSLKWNARRPNPLNK